MTGMASKRISGAWQLRLQLSQKRAEELRAPPGLGATRFGLHAVDALHQGCSGQMVALHGTNIDLVPLSEATSQLKLVPPELIAEAEVFFG